MEQQEEEERISLMPSVLQIQEQYVAGKMVAAISKRQMAEGLIEGIPPPMPLLNPA